MMIVILLLLIFLYPYHQQATAAISRSVLAKSRGVHTGHEEAGCELHSEVQF